MAQRHLDNSLYTHQPNFYNGYYYIHRHHENIGKMNMQQPETDASLAALFSSYKQGKDATLSNVLTNQYMQLLQHSMHINSDNVFILNQIFNPENNAQNILNKINKELQEGFENQFTNNKIISMLNIEKEVNWSASEKKNSHAQEVQALTKILQGDMSNAQQGFRFLDRVLTSMAQAVKLLDSNKGDKVAAILSNAVKRKFFDISALGTYLTAELNSFIEHSNGSTLNSRDAIEAATLLSNIGEALRTGQTSKGNDLTIDALQGLVQKNFYSTFAEILAGHISEAAVGAAVKYIAQSTKDITRTGAIDVKLEMTDPQGNYYDDGGQFANNGEAKQGKADIKFENVEINLESLIENGQGTFTMSVGISNKAYVKKHIGIGSLDRFSVFSLGGGMTLGNAFSLLVGNNIKQKYLGYNVFGHGDELPSALGSLKDTLLTRSIIYLASSRGKDDFSLFLLLNGELLSVWDIIKYSLNNTIGVTNNDNVDDENQSRTGIYFSIANEKLIRLYANSRFWTRRIVKTNDTISKSAMKVHIIPKQIINFAKQNSSDLTS